uniref:Uncharacterized protein n=1 Tax=Candidatus Kentrum sp. LPFa TaxID=2126335 RepID=A0A450WT20_9GAMM|nr:MAG: hypothetical protein BECKLPF1236B_GA0070989_12028 [Candidatus Kentron sp. LPFa]
MNVWMGISDKSIHAEDYDAIRAIYGKANMIMTPILEEKYRRITVN